jgi:CRISPR/Cas system-associated exonuclease Cas4 (RecB family)
MIDMSFSQANQYLLCKRSWSFSKVDGLRGLPSLASSRGTMWHSRIEEAIMHIEYKSHPFLRRAVEVIEDFESLEAEKYLVKTMRDVKVRGYADAFGVAEGQKIVIDWKFPGKHPGKTPKKDYVDQLQLYGLLAEADKLMVVFPEHEVSFSFGADVKHGQRVLDRLVEVGQEIIETKAFERYGLETEPTPNWTCKSYCNYRHLCPLGA